jgi:hypothetical protein
VECSPVSHLSGVSSPTLPAVLELIQIFGIGSDDIVSFDVGFLFNNKILRISHDLIQHNYNYGQDQMDLLIQIHNNDELRGKMYTSLRQLTRLRKPDTLWNPDLIPSSSLLPPPSPSLCPGTPSRSAPPVLVVWGEGRRFSKSN